jgi:hypothetical protein
VLALWAFGENSRAGTTKLLHSECILVSENAFLTWNLFLLVIEFSQIRECISDVDFISACYRIFPDTWEWQKHDLCAWECISDVDCISARFRISRIREWRKSIAVSDNTFLTYFAKDLQLFRHTIAEHKYQQQKACPWSSQSMALVCPYRVRCIFINSREAEDGGKEGD